MNTQRKLIIQQLDSKIRILANAKAPFTPATGWIKAIRTALRIPRKSIAKKLGITEATLFGIEQREAEGTVTLKTLRETAAAMDLELVYGFVPRDGSLETYISRKATEAAERIVTRTSITMALEDQAVSARRLKKAMKEKAQELENSLPGFLWD